MFGTPDAFPSQRVDWQDISQERNIRPVRTEEELQSILGEIASNNTPVRIVIADVIPITQTIVLNNTGIEITSNSEISELIVSSGVTPVFSVSGADVKIIGIRCRGDDSTADPVERFITVSANRLTVTGCNVDCKQFVIQSGFGDRHIVNDNKIDIAQAAGLYAIDISAEQSQINNNVVNGNTGLGVRLSGNKSSIIGNAFASITATLSADYLVISSNRWVSGGIVIDGATYCTITGNVVGQGIRESGSGGSSNAIIGNAITEATIVTNVGTGFNTIVGNTGTTGITSHADDEVAYNT